jgi:hypothetical protein
VGRMPVSAAAVSALPGLASNAPSPAVPVVG